MARSAQIVGWGSYTPSRVLTNNDLAQMVETSDEWIYSRTGIRERRIASNPHETTATMATQAAWEALRVAGLPPGHLDVIIVATVTPDYAFPATSCLVQDALGAHQAAAFDVSAGCAGFVYALAVANGLLVSGMYNTALVIGAETLSRIIDWTDRTTCVLFGDGAGAAVLQASSSPGGILSTVLGADGSGGDLLILPAGGSRRPASAETVAQREHYVRMNGREVFRFATRVMAQAAQEAIHMAGLRLEDIDLFVPHQANLRIIEASAKALKVPWEKVFVNLDRYGNTSAASIPIALCEAAETGRLHRGDHVVLVGFGAGLTWAAAVIQWTAPFPMLPRPRWQGWVALVWPHQATVRSQLRRLLHKLYNVLEPGHGNGPWNQFRRWLAAWIQRLVNRLGVYSRPDDNPG